MIRNLIPLVAVMLIGCGKPAQIGADPEVHKSLDALFTATTARSIPLLDQSTARLTQLRDEGRLPASAFDQIEKIIAKARAGSWEAAAHELYPFIQGQETGPDRELLPKKKAKKR